MSSTEPPAEALPFPEDEDQTYFRALEEAFLQLRGSATLLGPDDWSVAREWRRLGVPLDLVISVMEALFARQRERRSKRGISSLKFFRAAVAAGWDERLAIQAGGAATAVRPAPSLTERLEALAAAIPDQLAGAASMRARVMALQGDPLRVEEALERLDQELLTAVGASLGRAELAAVEERVARAARRSGGEMTPEELIRVQARLRSQAVRALRGAPVLSLFAPESFGAGGSETS